MGYTCQIPFKNNRVKGDCTMIEPGDLKDRHCSTNVRSSNPGISLNVRDLIQERSGLSKQILGYQF